MPAVRHDIPLDQTDRLRPRIIRTIPFDGYFAETIRCAWCEAEIIHWYCGKGFCCEDCGRETFVSAHADALFAVISETDLAYLTWRFGIDPENQHQAHQALYSIPGWRSQM